MLFCLRALRPGMAWKNGPLSFSFWAINIGLALMVLLSTLPIGPMQVWASVEYGTWYARSGEFRKFVRKRWARGGGRQTTGASKSSVASLIEKRASPPPWFCVPLDFAFHSVVTQFDVNRNPATSASKSIDSLRPLKRFAGEQLGGAVGA